MMKHCWRLPYSTAHDETLLEASIFYSTWWNTAGGFHILQHMMKQCWRLPYSTAHDETMLEAPIFYSTWWNNAGGFHIQLHMMKLEASIFYSTWWNNAGGFHILQHMMKQCWRLPYSTAQKVMKKTKCFSKLLQYTCMMIQQCRLRYVKAHDETKLEYSIFKQLEVFPYSTEYD
jgi:hypothetical protein